MLADRLDDVDVVSSSRSIWVNRNHPVRLKPPRTASSPSPPLRSTTIADPPLRDLGSSSSSMFFFFALVTGAGMSGSAPLLTSNSNGGCPAAGGTAGFWNSTVKLFSHRGHTTVNACRASVTGNE